MLDKNWLRQIASANIKDGNLHPKDDELAQRLARDHIDEAMNQLFEGAAEIMVIFNQYADQGRLLRVLPVRHKDHKLITGVILLVASAQLTMSKSETRPGSIEAQVVVMHEFQQKAVGQFLFLPRVDEVGGVSWVCEDRVYNIETMLQNLFKRLIMAAY